MWHKSCMIFHHSLLKNHKWMWLWPPYGIDSLHTARCTVCVTLPQDHVCTLCCLCHITARPCLHVALCHTTTRPCLHVALSMSYYFKTMSACCTVSHYHKTMSACCTVCVTLPQNHDHVCMLYCLCHTTTRPCLHAVLSIWYFPDHKDDNFILISMNTLPIMQCSPISGTSCLSHSTRWTFIPDDKSSQFATYCDHNLGAWVAVSSILTCTILVCLI